MANKDRIEGLQQQEFSLDVVWVASLLMMVACGEGTRFTDVSSEAGLGAFVHVTGARGDFWMPEILGSGAATFDWDRDQWPDLLLVGGGTWEESSPPALRLFHNNRDGTFTEKTAEAGLRDLFAFGFGLATSDFDNDGDTDVYLTALEANLLLRNDGGVFTEIGAEAGVRGRPEWSTAALFFDADRDGWLDLYVGGYVQWDSTADIACAGPQGQKIYCTPHLYTGAPHRLYHNNGDGSFVDWTAQSGLLPTPGKTLGAVTLDYNGDLWPDLAVANDLQADQIFENNRDGTFTERGVVSGIAFDARGIATAGMGISAGDIDGSGEPALVIGNFSNQMTAVFRHVGAGRFTDLSAASRIGGNSRLTLAFGLFLFDVDLDGDQDVFVANGHIHEHVDQGAGGISYRQAPHLFINQGKGTFLDEAAAFPAILGRGAAYVDFDRDGDLDMLVTQNGNGVRLWRNELGGRYIRILLQGTRSNRDGIGARVTLFAAGLRQVRYVYAGGSYLSQSERVLTFGLGARPRADSVRIEWPSGRITSLPSVQVDTLLVVTEPEV